VRRRSRDVLVIGERLLDEVDLGLLQEPEPATEAALRAGIALKLPVVRDREPAGKAAVEPKAAEKGDAERSDFDDIGEEPQERRAPAGIDSEREPEPVGTDVRDETAGRPSSRPRPSGWGTAASVAIAAVLATVVTIVIAPGGSGTSPPDPRVGRQEAEAPGPHGGLGPASQVERREPAVPEPGRGDGEAQASGSSAPSAPSTTAEAATAPVPTAAQAPIPEPSPAPRSMSAPARDAGPAVVHQEFGP
jgi:hypothetical protein